MFAISNLSYIQSMSITILAIESSCDDTSVALIQDAKMIYNGVYTQKIHEAYGGVVPELASRKHEVKILPLVQQALKTAGIKKGAINAIAFTRGPGLLGSLLVGTSFAKSLALSLDIPLIEVNHMQAHILAHFIDDPKPAFPFICLTVSGGHTQIVLVNDFLDMEILGQTIDDAAGEAFDKTGKLIGLPYPAGPHIDRLAREGIPKFSFPEPRVDGLDFSFSGLKTSILYFLRKEMAVDPGFVKNNLADICASVQNRIISILMNKLIKAVDMYTIKNVAISGGVSANSGLRESLMQTAAEKDWNAFIPKFEYCTDNAGMIAITAWEKYKKQEFCSQDVSPLAHMEFERL